MRKKVLVFVLCLGLGLTGCSNGGELKESVTEKATNTEESITEEPSTEKTTTEASESVTESSAVSEVNTTSTHDTIILYLQERTSDTDIDFSDANTAAVIDGLTSYFHEFSALTQWDENSDALNLYFGCAMYLGTYFDEGTNGNTIYSVLLDSLAYLIEGDTDNFALNNMLLQYVLEDVFEIEIPDASMNQYNEGQYKVGTDIPAGEYVIFSKSSVGGYFCLSSDSNQNDIITNENFDYNSIIAIHEGEYLELSRSYAVPIDEASTLNTSGSGTFKIGVHLPAGEYKVTADSNTTMGYYCIYNDNRQDDIEDNDNFNGSSYVTVSDGQYLTLSRCHIEQ